MNLGFAVLYAAFAVVAVWLLSEVLLQHRAPTTWRLLALAGFLAVAGGVYLRNVLLIVPGVLAFGVGQVLVGRMVKRAGADGRYWAVRRPVGPAPESAEGEDYGSGYGAEPVGEVGPVEPAYQDQAYQDPAYQEPAYQEPAYPESGYQQPDGMPAAQYDGTGQVPVYSMEPLPEDTDSYGVYTGLAAQQVREQFAAAEGYGQQYAEQPYAQVYEQAGAGVGAGAGAEYGQYQQQYSYDYAYAQQPQTAAQDGGGYYDPYQQYGYYDEYGQYHAYQQQPQQPAAADGYYAPES
jgi:hypothetical protein